MNEKSMVFSSQKLTKSASIIVYIWQTEFLNKYKDLILDTAEFMADFAIYNEDKDILAVALNHNEYPDRFHYLDKKYDKDKHSAKFLKNLQTAIKLKENESSFKKLSRCVSMAKIQQI